MSRGAEPGRPTISINVCTYNAGELLAKALDCMVRQETGGEFSLEIVVIDDGSTDGAAEGVAEIAATSRVPIRYCSAGGKGVSHARNTGAAESRGEWIAWFDQDQLAEPTWLKDMWSTARETGADLVDGPRDLLLTDGQRAGLSDFCRACLGEISDGDTVHEHVRRHGSCTGNALIKKEVFDAVGGFDESILDGWEDWDYVRRLRAKGFACWYSPKALVHHVVSPDRLDQGFFKWHATRVGAAFASRDLREWGLPKTLLACFAKMGQALFVNAPLLAWAWFMREKKEQLTRICLLLRAVSYARKTLFFVSPRLFPQEGFHARVQLRNEPRFNRNNEDR